MAQIKPLDEHLQKVAIEELGEVPNRLVEDLEALVSWIEQQPHLRARTDPQFLVQFLRGCKFSLEKAKSKIDTYFTLRTKYPEMLCPTDVDAKRFQDLFKRGCVVPLPRPLNDNGPRIVVYRHYELLQDQSIEDLILLDVAMHDIMLVDDPYACIHGLCYVVDLSSLSLNFLSRIGISVLSRSTAFLEKAMPFRAAALCIINMPEAAAQICQMITSVLPQKIKERVFFCGHKLDNLLQHIPLEFLPEEYGGSNGSLTQICADYLKVWETHRDFFKENSKYGTDEHLRLGKPIDFDSVYGLSGSFRKLEVD